MLEIELLTEPMVVEGYLPIIVTKNIVIKNNSD